jgi:hypothetical protein
MAASAWVIFDIAKKHLGNNTYSLSAASGFKATLHSTGASANLVGDVTTFASIGSEAAGGGYVDLAITSNVWTTGASAGQYKWDITTDPVWTATSSSITNIRYCVMRFSAGATTSGYPLCYAALSTASFSVAASNTITVQINANGVFTLT